MHRPTTQTHRRMRALLRGAAVCCALACVGTGAATPEAIEIPFADGIKLKGWMYRPTTDGENKGPFPVAIINHGSPPGGAPERAKMDPKYPVPAEQFLKWGFVVVVPTRRGYGATGGHYAEASAPCYNPGFYDSGLESAKDIAAAVRFATALPYVDSSKVLLVGQSAGGWAVLAAATRTDIGAKAVLNFAGGRGGHKNLRPNENCSPDQLVRAAGDYGKEAKRPSLWIYAENDSYFAPGLAGRMFDNYQSQGGNARMIALPAFGKDGHALFGARDGVSVWRPLVEPFLKETGFLK